MRSSASFFCFSALAVGLTAVGGCADRDPARDAGESTHALVRVDLSYTRIAGASDARFDAQAHFVRYQALDPAGVPTLLGVTDFDTIPLDGCRAVDGTADFDEALASDPGHSTPAEVLLLDAGRLELRGPIDRVALLPHHYPELVPFVSGTVYGGDEARPLALGLGQSYQVAGEGGEEVGPFTAQATAPRIFPALTVEPLRRGGDLELRWSERGDEGVGEPATLELKGAPRSGAHGLRCRVRDDGSFSLPHELVDALPPSALQGATVTLARIARGPLSAPGIGAGELTFALRDVEPLLVLP